MIRRLRQRHRLMTGALIVPLIGVGIALASRPTDAVMETLPPPLAQDAASDAALLIQHEDHWTGASIDTTVRPDQIVLSPTEPLRKPDCLLYWAPTLSDAKIPDGAVLLGSVTGDPDQRLPVPAAASMTTGHLLIYSLGHSEVFATMPLAGEGAP
jgi:hypothetical protein